LRYENGGYIGTAKIIGGASNRTTDMERATSSTPLEKKAYPRFDSPVRIRVVSYRCRLCDADGVSAKAAIDGLVHCGVLQDDGPRYVEEVAYSQVKVKNKEQEKTEIWIEEV